MAMSEINRDNFHAFFQKLSDALITIDIEQHIEKLKRDEDPAVREAAEHTLALWGSLDTAAVKINQGEI